MKFWFEFVACCGTPPPPVQEPPPPLPEDSSQLAIRRRYRKRIVSSRSVSSVEWQPSLCAISEDNVVVEKDDRPASERTSRTKSGSNARVHVRSYSEDYSGRHQLSSMIPAFSASPFMF